MNPRAVLSGSFQRRLARTPLRRAAAVRSLSSTAPVAKPSKGAGFPVLDPHSSSAFAAFLARLSLPSSTKLHPALLAALTHPSYAAEVQAKYEAARTQYHQDVEKGVDGAVEPVMEEFETNELLSSVGNSLLGLFAAEELAARYPHMPSAAISSAVTAYVGPDSLLSVGRELGLQVVNTKTPARNAAVGLPIRWTRVVRTPESVAASAIDTPVAHSYKPREGENKTGADVESWTAGIASVVRALVGLVYQEAGMHAARDFVSAHFMSRHVDLTAIFNIRNPKHVLSTAVTKQLVNAGVPITPETGRIQSRVLASTGTTTQSPLFNIGLFLTNGLKLAEGHGSSLAMAEHRAAMNALLSLFLVKNQTPGKLPTSVHAARPIQQGGRSLGDADVSSEAAFLGLGSVGAGQSESLVGLGKGLRWSGVAARREQQRVQPEQH